MEIFLREGEKKDIIVLEKGELSETEQTKLDDYRAACVVVVLEKKYNRDSGFVDYLKRLTLSDPHITALEVLSRFENLCPQ